jgi:hypothetical protein
MEASLCRPAYAAEGGTSSYLKGYKDFLSGVLPTVPGLYLRNDIIYYSGNIDATIISGRVRIDLSQWTVSDVISPTVVTPLKILGGTYAFGAIVPFTKVDVNVGIDTARGGLSSSGSAFNLDDVYLNPIILGWNAGNFHWMALVSIAAPAGPYSKNNIANTGLNYWSVQPQFSITYYEPETGWDVSAALAYVINTENYATHYLTGNIFHLDWAVGKQITTAWKVGVVGYLMEQITGDSGSGATLGPDKASVWALGPAATYSFKINQMPISIVTKWTHEIAATNTFRGDTVTTAFSFKF